MNHNFEDFAFMLLCGAVLILIIWLRIIHNKFIHIMELVKRQSDFLKTLLESREKTYDQTKDDHYKRFNKICKN